MSQHTQGPWRIFENLQTNRLYVDGENNRRLHSSRRIISANNVLLAEVTSNEILEVKDDFCGFKYIGTHKEMLEVAHLIAAAPELLEALEACLPYVKACIPNPIAVGEPTVIELAESAIKKARGI